MDVASIVTLIVYVCLIIFLVVLSCVIYQIQAQAKVHPRGQVNLQQQCQNDMQESGNMKNLQKMKKLRSDRKILLNLSNTSQPKTTSIGCSNIWTTNDFVETTSMEMEELSVKDTNALRVKGTKRKEKFEKRCNRGMDQFI